MSTPTNLAGVDRLSGRLLVVDDDASIRLTFTGHLSDEGHVVQTCESAEAALATCGAFDPAIVISDVRMSGMSGLELLTELKRLRPDVDVVIMTAHEDMRTAIDAMQQGAYDYLVKPLDLDHVDLVIQRCLRDRATRHRAQTFAAVAAEPFAMDRIVGRDPTMIETYKLIGQVSATRAPVLVRGETGTGKELVARAIHFNSAQKNEPFIAVNCTALSETLLESELFGHVRGAFTGAVGDRKGRFELAGRGTLFLDEIGETSPAFQAKLLRVLQEREFTPVGGERTRRTEARVIAATNRDLEEGVQHGSFREDLYYRLRVVEIRVPALRDRRGDIELLGQHFVERLARDMHVPPARLSPAAIRAMNEYAWPGNVRELENTMARAMVVARGGVIAPEHLALATQESTPSVAAKTEAGDEDDSLETVERRHVARVLAKLAGNKRQTAQRLGISRPTLDRLIEKHGLAQIDSHET